MTRTMRSAKRPADGVTVGRAVSRKSLGKALTLAGERPQILHGRNSGEFVEMAKPTSRAPTAAHTLRFPKVPRLELAVANNLAAMGAQVLPPYSLRPKL